MQDSLFTFEKKEIPLHCSNCSSISFVLRSIFSFLWNWICNLTYRQSIITQPAKSHSISQENYLTQQQTVWLRLLACYGLSCAGYGCHFQSNHIIDFTLAPHWFMKTSELQNNSIHSWFAFGFSKVISEYWFSYYFEVLWFFPEFSKDKFEEINP